jgi:magnesium transporter
MELSIIGYDPIGAWMKSANTVEELLQYRNTGGLTWININALNDPALIEPLIKTFGIHPLTVDDILDTEQRPKAEEFDRYLFITFKAVSRQRVSRQKNTAAGELDLDGKFDLERKLDLDQISLIVTWDTVITFQEIPGDSFDGIRRRIMHNLGRIRRYGADYLAYTIMNSVVEEYFLVLDSMGAELEDFEERALDENDAELLPDLQRVKQNLLRVRRAISPLRESFITILRLDTDFINPEFTPFFKDLHDNVIQAAETLESYREILAGVMEVNLSTLSNRMNKVMKVLTIISTIFIPLTFIVGVYGMNFAYMPELSKPYAYPLVWAVMVLIAVGMLIFFKKRHWL